jgi:hypothetical protein
LNCSITDITVLPNLDKTSLETLNCSWNPNLTSFPFPLPPSLQYISYGNTSLDNETIERINENIKTNNTIDLYNDDYIKIEATTKPFFTYPQNEEGTDPFDPFEGEKVNIKNYLKDANHIAVQIVEDSNSIIFLDKTNIKASLDDALRYRCKEANGEFNGKYDHNVIRKPPLFVNLIKFGLLNGYGYASQIQTLLDPANTHQYYILEKTETKLDEDGTILDGTKITTLDNGTKITTLDTVATKNFVDNPITESEDYYGASHCQVGQGGDVYTWFKANVKEVNPTSGGNKNRSIKAKRAKKGGKKTKNNKKVNNRHKVSIPFQ